MMYNQSVILDDIFRLNVEFDMLIIGKAIDLACFIPFTSLTIK